MSYTNLQTVAKNISSEVLLADYDGQVVSCRAMVKTVLPKLTEEIVGRLAVAQSLRHKNIQEVIDYGECGKNSSKKQYVSSRYVPSVSLTQVLTRLDFLQKKPPIPFVINVLCDVCSALAYIHETVVDKKLKRTAYHGRVCPDNIIITMHGDIFMADAAIADIVDFRYSGTALVNNDVTVYAHPLIESGKPVRPFHELYSAGLLLLCMLIGKNHFEGFCDSREAEKLKAVGQYFPSIPDELDKIIEKATRYRGLGRFTRYEHAGEFSDDLAAYSVKEDVVYDRDMTSLLLYALFNHLDNEPEEHHEIQRKKARKYIQTGNDNALKMLLGNLLKLDGKAELPPEEAIISSVGINLGRGDDLLDHLAEDNENGSANDFNDRETICMEEVSGGQAAAVAPEVTYTVPQPPKNVVTAPASLPIPEQRPKEVRILKTRFHAGMQYQPKIGTASEVRRAAVPARPKKEPEPQNGVHTAVPGAKIWQTTGHVGTPHPFIAIVKNTGVVKAELFYDEPVAKKTIHQPEESQAQGTTFDSFEHITKKQTQKIDIISGDSFSNLLKKGE